MTQCMVHVGKLEKKVHSVVVGCSVLQIFMKSKSLKVLLTCLPLYLIFCLVLPNAENGVLKISNYDCGIIFSPFNFVWFYYHVI